MTRFTPQQRAAIDARTGSSLLAANAGSGKTAVMVERIAAAVREDEVPVSAILALTFTEKAAGELAERLRRRLTELGEDEHARAVDGAWIGTIHGFCARLLRSQPLAAGLDPRFEVLEAARGRAARGRGLRARAGGAGRAQHGAAAIDLAASYGPALRELILNAYATLRARGHDAAPRAARSRPRRAARRPRPPARPRGRGRESAGAAGPRSLAGGGARGGGGREALGGVRRGRRRGRRRAAAAARRAWRRGGEARGRAAERRAAVPWPGALNAAELKLGAKALQSEPCEAYRAAWGAYRAACADFHARAALTLLDALLDRFGAAYDAAKAERAAVDFDDLELRAQTLLADAKTRERWSERFELIMIDEFQDTNAVQLGILEALERDNLFAVGDEFQSIYRFRHADVTIFRDRASVAAARAGALARGQLPLRGGAAGRPQRRLRARARRALLAAARRPQGDPDGQATARCGCSRSTRPRARRTSSCSSRHAGLGRARRRARPRAGRRPAVAPRRGAADRRPPADRARATAAAPATWSCSSARRRRCGCSRRRSRSRACRPTSSAAAATGPRSRSATAWRGCACSPTRRTRRRC